MSLSPQRQSDAELTELLAGLLDDTLSDEQFATLDRRLREEPETRQIYLDYVQIHDELPDLAVQFAESEAIRRVSTGEIEPFPHSKQAAVRDPGSTWFGSRFPRRQHRILWQGVVASIVMLAAAVLFLARQPDAQPVAARPADGAASPEDRPKAIGKAEGVRFSSLAHARFFGELPPAVESSPALQRDYVLMTGMVELAFRRGASAIIEGPAVFRVTSDESLALDVGHLSVHAPDGAEGFRVETPTTDVVDRGTRFSVRVGETTGTDVQVVEGAADVYRKGGAASTPDGAEESAFQVRLTRNEAQRFAHAGEFSASDIPFDPQAYQRQLPDRVISYKATTGPDGGAEDLVSVTVQRGGTVQEIPVEELIPSEVTWFSGEPNFAYLVGHEQLPGDRAILASDQSLITGIINPSGSSEPLSSSPVLDADDESATPGMAVRFAQPVQNGPGADIVLFDLQTYSNPPEGDAFHVSPLAFDGDLRSHTIHAYDLTMESPHALELTKFYVYVFEETPGSLGTVLSAECAPMPQAVRFRALAVGIDLSDLGYPIGATVEGLFLQDALTDEHVIDPVFIGGFPPLK